MTFFLQTVVLASLATASPADDHADAANLVETAVEAGSFSTLATALEAAGLVDTLANEGPFTVFAPTDAAFARLPEGTLDELLKPANKDRLTSILLYHVVPGRLPAAKVTDGAPLDTLAGQRLDLTVSDDGVAVDDAAVTATDVRASNGIIHVIDGVLLPAEQDIVQTAASAGSFETLLAAARAAGLVEALKGDGPLTVFAPTDAAFAKLPEGTLDELLKPENKERLKTILLFHVVEGRVYSDAAAKLDAAPTLAGLDAPIEATRAGLAVAGARVVTADLDASNGVVHVIDAVMLPPATGSRGR